jgi:hypothetical protein
MFGKQGIAGPISGHYFRQCGTGKRGGGGLQRGDIGREILLGSVTLATEPGPVPGWQIAVFLDPIKILANTTYVAAYYTPNGKYVDDYYSLNNSIINGPINVPASATVGGNGVYYYGMASAFRGAPGKHPTIMSTCCSPPPGNRPSPRRLSRRRPC